MAINIALESFLFLVHNLLPKPMTSQKIDEILFLKEENSMHSPYIINRVKSSVSSSKTLISLPYLA